MSYDGLQRVKNFVVDLDGVVYLLNTPIPENVEFLRRARLRGFRMAFLTNNTFLLREGYMEKLRSMGIEARVEEIFSSAFVTAECLRRERPHARVYAIGEEGLKEELKRAGLRILPRFSPKGADFVVVGLDRRFTFQKMKIALDFLLRGAQLVGTNPDPTYPMESGVIPGAGAILASLECASGRKARVIGKPSPEILLFVLDALGFRPEETAIVGDRIDTDVLLGKNCGVSTILVLTGVTQKEEVLTSLIKPDVVVGTLQELQGILNL
ncbi:MAG: HAD-IIA family hydrolase [Candidatus Caldatribacterium sp.]|uniref:HAD-IIA family hydrolase n=1 Tax=Candidatus Caldatribacterium sp. TaxID=2282143 RepID=UPI002998B75B|nr:HAD-IIA family hydrolase [Candidatus Caldatribacterium sp.]MCX7731474.1 HAD-IIA family hydrolase [Candidatus Caldatribacterium sp.]MDW8080654.1 HAD-IIA family hydrolase [Candidatus Calescibacterium sp.]